MSNWTVELEFAEGTSSKFWRARVEDGTMFINYGRVGTAGQTQVKDFGDAAMAQREYDKLVGEKRRKGYVDSGGGAASVDEDEVDDETYADDEDDYDAPAVVARTALHAAVSAPAAAPAGKRLVLEAGSRKVETYVSVDGNRVRLDSTETYGSPELAKEAEQRLREILLTHGYKEG